MASKKRRVTKKAPARKVAKKAPARKVATKAPARKATKKAAPSSRAEKAKVTKATTQRRLEVQKFERAAAKRYGRKSQTTTRLKELTANARRWELEAKKAKTLAGKKRARANASKALAAARNTFKAATREATHGQARQRGWYEVEKFGRPVGGEADTFTAYEHARYGAGSVLSLLESRPGVVGVLSYRRVSQIERASTGLTNRGALTPELQKRADAMAAELGMGRAAREEFEAMLLEAELYGVELELEVENYTGE